ncbi:MAG: DUF1850 domain-containing protein [Thermoprotei archaeon]
MAQSIDGVITIEYKFMHSSERTPWIEYWVVNSNGFYVTRICWTSGGAGHPSNPEDFNGNTEVIDTGYYYCAVNVSRYLGTRVLLDLSHTYNASLAIGNRAIECTHNSYCMVELVVRKLNLLDYLLVKFSLLRLYLREN